VSTLVVLFSIVSICMGKSLYRNNTPKGSPLIRIIEVNITILDFFFSAYFLRPKI
jgi:peptide/histidine transporter 3/4